MANPKSERIQFDLSGTEWSPSGTAETVDSYNWNYAGKPAILCTAFFKLSD